MAFKAYEDLAVGPMVFPIGGKTYTVPEVGYQTGLAIQRIQAGDDDLQPEDQYRLLLGDAYEQMVTDNVPAAAFARVILTCLTDYREGREMAEQVWEAGIDPEALAPQGAPGQTSTSTGEESEIPTPASTTGTTSRRASSPRTAKKPKRGSGTSSSSVSTGA